MLPARAFIASAALVLTASIALSASVERGGKASITRSTTARVKPSSLSASLGSVPPGTELTLLSQQGTWTQVTDGRETGWVATDALRLASSTPAGSSGEAVALDSTREALATGSGVVDAAVPHLVEPAAPPAETAVLLVDEAASVQPSVPVVEPAVTEAAPSRDLRARDESAASEREEVPFLAPTPGLLRSPRLEHVPAGRKAEPLQAAPPLGETARPVLVSFHAAPPTGEPAVAAGWTDAPRVLGLRESPSYTDRMTGAILQSAPVRVLERSGSWGLVESRDGRSGWIVLAALESPLRPRSH